MVRERERERNNVKIMYKELQYMNSYYNFCAFMYNFTPIDVGVFFIKLCKITYFFVFGKIMQPHSIMYLFNFLIIFFFGVSTYDVYS